MQTTTPLQRILAYFGQTNPPEDVDQANDARGNQDDLLYNKMSFDSKSLREQYRSKKEADEEIFPQDGVILFDEKEYYPSRDGYQRA